MVFFESVEGVYDSLHVSLMLHPLQACAESWLTEHPLNTYQWVFPGPFMNVYLQYAIMYVNVCASSICLHAEVRTCVCARVFFPCTLPICSRPVAAQCQHTDVWPLSFQQEFGICKEKQREQFTQNNKSVMSKQRYSRVVLQSVRHLLLSLEDTSCSNPGTFDEAIQKKKANHPHTVVLKSLLL